MYPIQWRIMIKKKDKIVGLKWCAPIFVGNVDREIEMNYWKWVLLVLDETVILMPLFI